MFAVNGITRVLLVSMSLILVSCGGGEDEEELDPVEADASGLYEGTILLNGSTRVMLAAVAADGAFTGGIAAAAGAGNSRTFIGSGTANGSSFSATGNAYAPGTGPFPAGGQRAVLAFSGTIAEGVQINGSWSAGGENGTYTLNYRAALTNRGAQLPRLSGNYNLYVPPGTVTIQNAVVSVTSTGTMTYQTTPTACGGTGNVTIQDPSINVYNFTMTLSSCGPPTFTVNGLLVLDDAPAGGTNNMVVMFGTTAAGDLPFGFTGTK